MPFAPFGANVCCGRSGIKTIVTTTPYNWKARKILQILDMICVFFRCLWHWVYIKWCLCYPQHVLHKATTTKKWFKYLFWFIFYLSLINSFIIFKENDSRRGRTLANFRLALATQLIGGFSSRSENRKLTMKAASVEATTTPVQGHFIIRKGLTPEKLTTKNIPFCSRGTVFCDVSR